MKLNADQFLLYKLVPHKTKPGKFDKIPCDLGGDATDAHDSTGWTDCSTASFCASTLGDNYGVAFVLTENDPYFLLDIDSALVGDNWSPEAVELCNRFPGALVEVSQSGTGLHVIGSYSGNPPAHKCKNKSLNIELYTEKRFIALGIDSTRRGDANIDQSENLARVAAQHFAPDDTVDNVNWTAGHHPDARPILDDDKLIAKAMTSSSASSMFGQTASFADLWTANVEKLAAVYPDDSRAYDESSADAALAAHLCWWTGADCERIDRLMRRSALVRPKWDSHRTYLKITVGNAAGRAIAKGEFYKAPEVEQERQKIKPCDKAVELAESIKNGVELILNKNFQADGEPELTVTVHAESIHQVITRSFWSGAKSKLFVLTNEGALNMYKQEDMLRVVQKHFGNLWEQAEIEDALLKIEQFMNVDTAGINKLTKAVNGFAINELVDHLKMFNQRERVDTRVDMFADYPRVVWYPDKVTVMHSWEPIKIPENTLEPSIVSDYQQHFPELDDLLQQIVASRFASDRKKFYTWIKCGSDWGKGFFAAVLKSLGLCVELSVSECEKAFEGAPLGREAIEFARAFVVMFNEFKNVKSELKQLENELPVTPKNQLKQSAELFTKLFTSAESVDSLTGENGVEDQFANRFNYFSGGSALNDRQVFKDVGRRRYIASVTVHVAKRIDQLVNYYLEMGRDNATDAADRFGDSFHQRYGIENHFDRLSSSLPSIGKDFVMWVVSNHQAQAAISSPYLTMDDDSYYISSPCRLYSDWVKEKCNPSEAGTIRKKRDEVFDVLTSKQGIKQYWVNGKNFKALRVSKDALV